MPSEHPPRPHETPSPRARGPEAENILLLTRSVARGDERAFDRFYALYADRLYRHLLVVVRGEEGMAREAMQDCMLRVLRYARPFERERVFWGWLTTLARSAAFDLLRRRRRIRSRESTLPDDAQGPSGPAERADERLLSALHTALGRLSPEDRRCLERHYLAGVPQATLAAERGTSRKAVESRLARLRKRLKVMILDLLSHE